MDVGVTKLKEMWKRSIENPHEFWSPIAEELYWAKKWDKVLDDSNPPFYRWFVGGETNIAYNVLERYPEDRLALIWVSSEQKERRFTYGQLKREVDKWACLMTRLGVKKGDRVTMYMPMIPETAFVVLAAAKIGAALTPVYSGFGVGALAERIEDSGSKLVITVDAMRRRGKVTHLSKIALEASRGRPVVVFNYLGEKVEGNYIRAEDYLQPCNVTYTWAKSDDPLLIVYTSGTTAKPKGIYHGYGGYMVWAYAFTKWLFNPTPEDIFFSTADIGWMGGLTHGFYGPLLAGLATIWYEDAPDYPRPTVWWEILDRYKATSFMLSPTAVRLLMRYGEPHDYPMERLKLVFTLGEILGVKPWEWLKEHVCKNREGCYVVDGWGQTETGSVVTAAGGLGLGGIRPKPGSAGLPYPGVNLKIYNDEGKEARPGEKGYVVLLPPPPPGMTLGIWGDPRRYIETYWSRFKGAYFTGDVGYVDEEGYVYLLGRADDVIKIAGHRLSPAEVENVVLQNPKIAEAAAVEVPDEVRGSVLAIFAVPKEGAKVDREEVLEYVKREFGPVAVVSRVFIVNKLPKTRSGKIMRRVLRAVASGGSIGDITTLEDETSIDEVKKAIEEFTKEFKSLQ